MALDALIDIEEVVLTAVLPDAVLVAIVDGVLEEATDSAFAGRIAQIVLADTSPIHATIVAASAGLPEVLITTEGDTRGGAAAHTE